MAVNKVLENATRPLAAASKKILLRISFARRHPFFQRSQENQRASRNRGVSISIG
jgi:hypothetical protein